MGLGRVAGTTALFAAIASATILAPGASCASARYKPLAPAATPTFGFTTFPYDATAEAVDRTQRILAESGNLYGIHFDDGVPWAEALDGRPLPAKMQRDWDDLTRRTPPTHMVYLALSPLSQDRVTLAKPNEGSSLPDAMRGARLDDEKVKTAYLDFVRRAVRQFRPDVVNLGIEAGELAARAPDKWPQFVELYRHVRSRLKAEDPDLKIGISFGLQSLAQESVARRVKDLVADSDYLGLSFYPYMSPFHERFRVARLPAPPAQWREPLAWVRRFTDKPIAICETGYTTRRIDMPVYRLAMHGDTDLQRQYLADLSEVARRDRYLFVIWYLAVDYDRLYEKLPPGDGSNLLWRNIGFFDGQVRPKPAWTLWKEIVSGLKPYRTGRALPPPQPRASQPGAAEAPAALGFDGVGDLFEGPAINPITIEHTGPKAGMKSMRWTMPSPAKEPPWCVKTLSRRALADRQHQSLWARSDLEGGIVLQLEEAGGEAFFVAVPITTSWQRLEFDLPQFKVDPKKKQDGRLDMGEVVKIVLADLGSRPGGAARGRSIWLSDWRIQ